jgi:two-component system, response regulator PdtaR
VQRRAYSGSLGLCAVAVLPANDLNSPVVLVVEDEFLVRDEIVDFLRHSGCTVLEARSAEEAVALGRDYPVDVLLTDVDLNGLGSGLDIAKALRDDQPGIGVIYVSATPVDQERRVSDSLCFCKPYHEGVILHACRDLMRGPAEQSHRSAKHTERTGSD